MNMTLDIPLIHLLNRENRRLYLKESIKVHQMLAPIINAFCDVLFDESIAEDAGYVDIYEFYLTEWNSMLRIIHNIINPKYLVVDKDFFAREFGHYKRP